ncbi:Uu.00g068430.m01.CDS01 [Anthostomella pinea]|uniref:Uu.00g068430.m01.CDS01 n=1 Tax=Anthostomella pinea TaxID=933095 RepID=A0AAI8VVI9_9PEZI|nr:Uu.00g068430.m01.CDS01 [Anthostomella pinea]
MVELAQTGHQPGVSPSRRRCGPVGLLADKALKIWPFRSLLRLEGWTSAAHRRVVILGGAAHAIPPTTGQGAAQAFEDVFSLALLVARLQEHGEKLRWEDALAF